MMTRFRLARRHLHLPRFRFAAISATLALAFALATFLIPTSVGVTSPAGAWWSRNFERPEVLPAPYPFCCGTFWDTLLLSTTSSGAIVPDPTRPENHVFAARTGPNNGRDYADWSFLTQNHIVAHGSNGTSVWVHMRLYFPRNFQPTGYTAGQKNSEWNWLTEFHEAAGWATACASGNPASIALGILNSRRATRNPRFHLQLIGGVQSKSNCKPKQRRIDGPRVRLGHWYTLLVHARFSPTQSGLVQLWLDGRLIVNVHFPTVVQHPDGSVGNYYYAFGYYRLPASWDATVLYDDVAEGPTRASISRRTRAN
jgi:hypothetical protein